MSEPLLLSTWSFGQRGNNAAWPALSTGGSSLDAVETICKVVEADEEVDSVGFGGLPDRHGGMSLDGCIMTSPKECGSVCAVRDHLHVVSIARKLIDEPDCMMLAGDGADQFADARGFPKQELLAPAARESYEAWRRKPENIDWSKDSGLADHPMPIDKKDSGSLFDHEKHSDTIGALSLDAQGVLAGACSSSGLPYKLPGRVGDSPIIGHGLYVEPGIGAAVATGDGELIMGVCGSFLAVELMRHGVSPHDAIVEFLERVERNYDLQERAQVAMIVLAPDGRWASGSLRTGFRVAVRDDADSRIVDPEVVLITE